MAIVALKFGQNHFPCLLMSELRNGLRFLIQNYLKFLEIIPLTEFKFKIFKFEKQFNG